MTRKDMALSDGEMLVLVVVALIGLWMLAACL
jgi:hypothetical protein